MAKSTNDIQESWDRAVHCFGTAKIIEKKLKKIIFCNKIIKFIGLAIPLSIGSVVISFGLSASSLPLLLLVLGLFGVLQLVISLWALIDSWDNKMENYSDAKSKNQYYYDMFQEIAKRYNDDKVKYADIFNDILLKDNIQREMDNKINISEKEKRYGMRLALFQFGRKCASCGEIPNIKKPSNCNVCGK